MSNTSGIISEKDVRQIGDIKAVLSADKNNTSYLCTYRTINPWSTYKPINYPAITREDYPLSAFAHTGFKTNSSFQIVYDPPTGGSTSPYRDGDFRLYDKNGRRPSIPSNVNTKHIYSATETTAAVSFLYTFPNTYIIKKWSSESVMNNISNLRIGTSLASNSSTYQCRFVQVSSTTGDEALATSFDLSKTDENNTSIIISVPVSTNGMSAGSTKSTDIYIKYCNSSGTQYYIPDFTKITLTLTLMSDTGVNIGLSGNFSNEVFPPTSIYVDTNNSYGVASGVTVSSKQVTAKQTTLTISQIHIYGAVKSGCATYTKTSQFTSNNASWHIRYIAPTCDSTGTSTGILTGVLRGSASVTGTYAEYHVYYNTSLTLSNLTTGGTLQFILEPDDGYYIE